MPPATLRLSFDVPLPPDEVRRWWLDFPDDYRATDRREQPHRIKTLERASDRIEVMTWWPGGMKARETLRLRPDGSWTADVQMSGFRIRDEFRAEPAPGGTRLTILSEVEPASLVTRLLRPLVMPPLLRSMRRTWENAVAVLEGERGGRAQRSSDPPGMGAP